MHIRRPIAGALRSFRRAPLVPALVVLTLALGIGVTTAMVSVIDALALRPLPFAVADRLVEIWSMGEADGRTTRIAATTAADLGRHADVFAAVEHYQFGAGTLTGVTEPRVVSAPYISPGLLQVLGAVPVAGRLFADAEAAGASRSVLIAEGLWRGTFGADPAITGRSLTLDDVSYAIVGVLPERFRFPEASAEVWRVLAPEPVTPTRGEIRGQMQTIGVLAAGVTRLQADERLRTLSLPYRDSGALAADRVLTAMRLVQARATDRYRPALYTMLAVAALVLLAAAINVTNLLLVRASVREGEFALLAALGSSRIGLAAAMLIDGLLLGMAGGLGGVAVARLGLAGAIAIQPPQLTYLSGVDAALNGRALGVLSASAVVISVLVSLIPAWRVSRADILSVISRRSPQVAGAPGERWQAMLLTVQLAAMVLVLSLTGLLSTSFARATNVDRGFDTSHLTVADFMFSTPRYRAPLLALEALRELDRRLEAEVVGVRSTIAIGLPPYGAPTGNGRTLEIEGRPKPVDDIEWVYASVAADYFQVMGIPLIDGRTFAEGESADAIIVSDVMAKRFWGNRSPVGDRIRYAPKDPWRRIVGVAHDVLQASPIIDRADALETYVPFMPEQRLGAITLIARADEGARVPERMRAFLNQIDPDLPTRIQSMEERLAESFWQSRFFLRLAVAFSLAGLIVSGVGVYGAAAYGVTRRRREIAVRIAVGATRSQIGRLVLRRGLAIAAVGAVAGLLASSLAAQSIRAMLFETTPTDPVALAGATLILAALVIAGSLAPAIRAGRVDPMTVLKNE